MKINAKKVALMCIILFIIFIIYVFMIEEKLYMAMRIETYVPIFNKYEEYEETHSGFRNDGETTIVMKLSNRQVKHFLKKIKQNEHWRELPLTGFFKSHFKIENGYWFAIDRYYCSKDYYKTIKYDVEHMTGDDRAALNYTLAVFDTDNNLLYFYEMDT